MYYTISSKQFNETIIGLVYFVKKRDFVISYFYFIVDENISLNQSVLVIKNISRFAIANIGDEPLNLDEIEMVFDFNDAEEYNKFLSMIINNQSFEYIITHGKFNGDFQVLK